MYAPFVDSVDAWMIASAVSGENCDSTMSMNSRKTMPFTDQAPRDGYQSDPAFFTSEMLPLVKKRNLGLLAGEGSFTDEFFR